ncbi:TIGR04282 family arsenosugar biosynthesis glycosyltransferase [Methanosphaerula subterraneus]|uniref:TIGR04282 family arsenosugar biosynthesis glycosyltransferase n=1 Tax=Methanosphaerula subterraneus TaxID=3350244 RepID=UPI003F850AEF
MDRTEGRPLISVRRAIAVMAKEPAPGRVKTRLCPPLSPREAADLYGAFLTDTLALVAGTGVKGFIACDPDKAGAFFRDRAPSGMACIPQGSGDLGTRLARVSNQLFSSGFEQVLIVASDVPGMDPEHLSLAFASLDHADLVLGPCDDGGYYLIGTCAHVPALFAGIPWSTSGVLSKTLEQAEREGMITVLLPSCPDIDTMQDLSRLVRDLEAGARAGAGAGTPPACPATREALAGLGLVTRSERRNDRPGDRDR